VKRALDVLVSMLLLVLLSPVLIVLGVLVRLTSPGPAVFRQERMGRGFRPFFIYKFRTMVREAPRLGGPITFGEDARITRLGKILRKTKMDELPQLLNVLKGEMSLVGPRPEVRHYVEQFRDDYQEILKVRPGVTDLASLEYRDEAAILGRAEDPEAEYATRILPEKIRLAKEYVARSSFFFDLIIMARTALILLGDRLRPRSKGPCGDSAARIRL
jgi:lipopolysaccharide/colanic/teichoic acid biosynthesis glycosyltransferase